jgi:adenylate cyclase
MAPSRSSKTPTLIQLRLITGIVIGIYVTMHLANHALGLVSARTQESARPYFMWFWQLWIGQILLYGSLIAHAMLAFHSLIRRREFRMPRMEYGQLLLGLAIPYLLLVHIANTRATRVLTGIDIDYTYEIAMLWVDPWVRVKQTILVMLVWGHFVAGLHFWWRTKPAYRRYFPVALMFFVLVPVASLLGFAEVGKDMNARASADPGWFADLKARGQPADPEDARLRNLFRTKAAPAWLVIVGGAMLYVIVRRAMRRGKTFTVTYPRGVKARACPGMSILEVSRMAGRPHMSVCGGRARCTTCRVLVVSGAENIPSPGVAEARALDRINAPPGLRLACQAHPTGDVEVQPLLNPTLASPSTTGTSTEFGQEREVTVLFVDIRGSTRLAEKRLPFDVVFLLNQFFEEMAEAVEASNGHYSNFTGDGLMALFGLKAGPDQGARAALTCAASMLERLEQINERLSDELETPLAIGIGIHTGPAIVGRMGPPKAPFLTALGDTVNTAARLEGLTKEVGVPVVVSVATLDAGAMPHPPLIQAELRGRATRLPVAAIDLDRVRELLWTPLPESHLKPAAVS